MGKIEENKIKIGLINAEFNLGQVILSNILFF